MEIVKQKNRCGSNIRQNKVKNRQRRILYNDKSVSSLRGYNDYKYLCTNISAKYIKQISTELVGEIALL